MVYRDVVPGTLGARDISRVFSLKRKIFYP